MSQVYIPQWYKWEGDWANITPNIFKEIGIDPGIDGEVAPYLPLLRQDPQYHQYFTVSTGKVIAKDTLGFVTMAGLRWDILAALAAGNVAAATWTYSATDVAEGVHNAQGVLVTLGEVVVASMLTAAQAVGGTADVPIEISHPIGIAPYNFFRNWSDNLVPSAYSAARPVASPTDGRFTNLAFQRRVHPFCDGVLQYPVVPPADYPNAPFEQIAVIEEAAVVEGSFLTYNVNSNLAIFNESADSMLDVLCQVLRVDRLMPKAYLDRVKTRYPAGTGPNFGVIDRMPGSATGGQTDEWSFSGTVFGTALVNLFAR